ncbi:hypothetical protein EDB86DRAFT_3079591 [Lactarius hatsudake]|nr:hypothetical protein EDB86DRAFT_3079591 [Lactarius hatsudake]
MEFEDDVFNLPVDNQPPPPAGFHFDYEDEDDFMSTQRVPRPPLRSRPPIDFAGAGWRSTVNSNVGLPAFSAATCPPSHMSDTTLHSGLGRSAAHTFPHKTSSSPRPSPDVIASLTVAELCYNANYLKLHEKFDQVCRALAMKTVEGFTPANTLQLSQTVSRVPPPLRTKESCASSLGLHTEESRASSLGPSDSASQQMKFDLAYDKAIESLLETVELPSVRPHFLEKEVLWYYDDCATDKKYGDIITLMNMYQLKMNLAIRRLDGSKVSTQEYSNIRRSAAILIQRLIDLLVSDPSMAMHANDPKSRTKSFIRNAFKTEYNQAILELEAEHKLLRLLAESKAAAASNRARAASSIPPDNTLELPPAPIPQAQDVAPVNVAKRAFELSPGPKSPSASQAQKCSKDGIAPTRQKTTGPPVPSKPPRARKLVPTFLSRINAEPPSTNLCPVFVDPSADNLITVLTSEFPALTNAINLIRSMNVQLLFKQGKSSHNVSTLLERLQFADPGSPDIDEDNTCLSWGHDLFMAGGISPSSSLTTWEDVGSIATAFKMPQMGGFISDVYLEKILECLENCWVRAGGVITSSRVPVFPTTPPTLSYRDAAMSPAKSGILLKIKWPTPIAPTSTPVAPTENDSTSTHQPAARTEPMLEPSVALDEGTRADAASLKNLQVSELLTWISDNKLSALKSKRKDELIAVIVKSTEFAQVSKLAIQEIIDNRKTTKRPKRQLTAASP